MPAWLGAVLGTMTRGIEVFGHTVDNYFARLQAQLHIERVLASLARKTASADNPYAIRNKMASLKKLSRQLELLFPA